jgi:FtsH-binding integral membrane protein
MSCSNYVAKTFAHAAGMLAVSAIGSTQPLPFAKEGKFATIAVAVVILLLFIGLLYMPPGIFKYIAAIGIVYLFGSVSHNLVEKLKLNDTLYKTLVYTAAISVGMMVLAFMDARGRFISFGPVLLMSLMVLLGANLYFYFTEKARPDWMSTAAAVLFSLFISYDTQLIRKHALACVAGSADYINESMGLYLDILNLFSNLGE